MRLQKRQVISKESYKRQYCRTMIIYERHCISKSDYQRRWSSLVLLAVTASRVPGHAPVTPPAQPPQARSCTFLAFSSAPIGGVAPPPAAGACTCIYKHAQIQNTQSNKQTPIEICVHVSSEPYCDCYSSVCV